MPTSLFYCLYAPPPLLPFGIPALSHNTSFLAAARGPLPLGFVTVASVKGPMKNQPPKKWKGEVGLRGPNLGNLEINPLPI